MRKIIEPNQLTQEDMPLIVLVDDRKSFIGWGIKVHSSDNYNHAMTMIAPGYFASQNPGGFKKIPIKDYMKHQHFLKFWKIELSDEEKSSIIGAIYHDLNGSKVKGWYDYVGIIGQWLSSVTRVKWLRNINIPGLNYCSENVNEYFNLGLFHPSPSDINISLEKNGKASIVGYWFED